MNYGMFLPRNPNGASPYDLAVVSHADFDEMRTAFERERMPTTVERLGGLATEYELPYWLVYGLWPLMREVGHRTLVMKLNGVIHTVLETRRAAYRAACLRCTRDREFVEALWTVWMTAWDGNRPTAESHDLVRSFVLATCGNNAQDECRWKLSSQCTKGSAT